MASIGTRVSFPSDGVVEYSNLPRLSVSGSLGWRQFPARYRGVKRASMPRAETTAFTPESPVQKSATEIWKTGAPFQTPARSAQRIATPFALATIIWKAATEFWIPESVPYGSASPASTLATGVWKVESLV